MDARDEYSLYLSREKTPIFYWPEWLGAVDKNWKVELFKNANGEIQGALPYVEGRCMGFKVLENPVYTPYLGIIDFILAEKVQSFYRQGYEIAEKSIEFLKKFDEVNFRLRPGYPFWLPFRWAGFQLSPRITYKILPSDESILWSNLDTRLRNDIRKASNRYQISVKTSEDVEKMYYLYQKVFERKNKKVPMTLSWFRNLDHILLGIQARTILAGVDGNNNVASMAYLVEDHRTIYLFLTGIHPDFKQFSSLSLVIWEAIKMASAKNKVFDFEGSILPEVEFFFRGFGGRQETFFEARITNNKLLKFSRKIAETIR